jgi:transcription-repair coupling factor (superfamily II helicase)
MTDSAQKRLLAITEATDLGAGFQIAMRDLEIRGAGNLLGAEQSGHVAAVGFDLYTRLLAQAVEEMQTAGSPTAHLARVREEGQRARAELRGPAAVTLDLPLRAYLPEEYVPDAEVRLQMYRQMADVRTSRQVQEVARELRDRFGEPPAPAQALLDLLRLRVLALRAGVREVRRDGQTIVIMMPEGSKPAVEQVPRWLAQRLRARANLLWRIRTGEPLECGMRRWPQGKRKTTYAERGDGSGFGKLGNQEDSPGPRWRDTGGCSQPVR